MSAYRDLRHPVETAADARYAALRRTVVKLDAVLAAGVREGRRMSLKGKMAALTERAQDFTKTTEAGLDALSEKITLAESKREAALEKHHGYYDGIVAGIEESVAVIDRLSNVPLSGDGENSEG